MGLFLHLPEHAVVLVIYTPSAPRARMVIVIIVYEVIVHVDILARWLVESIGASTYAGLLCHDSGAARQGAGVVEVEELRW